MDVTARARADSTFNDRYDISDKIGQGGMGSVHRGVQRALNRPVAIKFMAPELAKEKGYVDRFLAEAQLAASLVHGSVVAVFDFGLVAGVPYLVTEYIPGQTLSDLLKIEGSLSVADTLAIARGTLDGLAAIHKLGIVHRDIKPANLLVLPGSPPTVKILDFGIAKQTTGAPLAEGAPQTATGMVMGTPEFMAPEQAAGDALTPAADIYAFSLVLYRMVVGEHPFKATSTLELLRMQIHNEVPVPDHILPGFRELLTRGLAKRPADRVGSATELRAMLDRAAPAAEAQGSFVQGATGGTKPTDRVEAIEVTAAAPIVSSGPPPGEVPTVLSRPERAPQSSRMPSLIGTALLALALVLIVRANTIKPPETWNHDWRPPFVRVPARTEPWPKTVFAQSHGFNLDDPKEVAKRGRLINYRELPEGQQQWDLVFANDQRDDMMHFSGFDAQQGSLLLAAQPTLATMVPGFRVLIDEGAMEVEYANVQSPGLLEIQLFSARDGDESGVIYRLRADLKQPGWEAMVSAPESCKTEVARTGNKGYHFDPGLWRMVARHEDAALAKSGTLRLKVKDHWLTATINGAEHTYDLGEVYRVKPGGLYPRLFAYPGTALLVKRVTLLGPLARGFQSVM